MKNQEDNESEEMSDDKKKLPPFGGIVLKLPDFTIECDRRCYTCKPKGMLPSYFPTIGMCFDELFDWECKKNLVNNPKKGDILAVRACIDKAADYINDIVEPLLNTKAYKHLKKKWDPETEIDLK